MIPQKPQLQSVPDLPATKADLITALSNLVNANPAKKVASIYNEDQDLLIEVGREFKNYDYVINVSNLPVTGNKYKLTVKWGSYEPKASKVKNTSRNKES